MAGSPDTEPSQHFELLPASRSALACKDSTTNNSESDSHPLNRRTYGVDLQTGMLVEAAIVAELP
jgi:hypothetical protein